MWGVGAWGIGVWGMWCRGVGCGGVECRDAGVLGVGGKCISVWGIGT